MVETDVHYPTDINLLFDAMRKLIKLTADYTGELLLEHQRQYPNRFETENDKNWNR